MQQKVLKLSIIVLCLISARLSPGRVFAQTNTSQILRISPIVLKVLLDPGTTQTQTITVENLLDTPLPIRISVEGFDAPGEEGGIQTSSQAAPLTSWISLDTSEALVPAKRTRAFEARVVVPATVPIGGYGAMIFFSPVLPGKTVAAKIGVVVLANVGVAFDKKNTGDITEFRFDKQLYQEGPVKATIRVKNTSLNYFTAKPSLTIKPLFGEEKIFELEEKTILPGKTRRWQKPLDVGNLRGVIYQAHLRVSLEQGDSVSAAQTFYGLPFTKIMLSALAVAITLYGIVFRGRAIKALRLLIKG
jgi:hypothetical protein